MTTRIAALAALLALCGCTAIPHGGPSRGAVANLDQVEHVRVTPAIARDLAGAYANDAALGVEDGLSALRASAGPAPIFRFNPGDVLSLTLFSFPASSNGSATGATAVEPSELGKYVVSSDGAVQLPYVGRFPIAGLELSTAQASLSRRFAGLGLFRRPSVAIILEKSPHDGILVTGAIGAPQRVPWTAGGRTLADTLTEALGEESTLLRELDDNRAKAAVEVDVLRSGQMPVTLPIARALAEDLPLRPGDRVVVRKEPKIVVAMLGSGLKENKQLAFASSPVLTDALARASGLDANVADGHAVFVMRQRSDAKPLLYDFAWDRASGVVAAQSFRLADGDVVYVAEAPIVAVQKVIGLLFQVALPVQAVR